MKKLFFALALALSTIATVSAQTKIGHVNSQKLLDTMPSRKAAIKDIQSIEASGLQELRAMDSTIQVAYQKYTEAVNKGTMSEASKQYEQGRIQRMQQSLETRQQEIDQILQNMTAEMNAVVLERIKKAVANVATLKKMNYIIDEASTLYSGGGIDCTNEVATELLKLEQAEAAKTGK